jgi:Flp pilus assembly protein TadG
MLHMSHRRFRRSQRGQSLIEFALIFPLLFLLVANVLNFGAFCFAWITVTDAARAGAEYLMLGGASVGGPSSPTAAQVTTLVTNDVVALPNKASLQVCVSTNNNGTITTSPSGCFTPPVDPETTAAGKYVLGSVRVTYTYQPLVPLWEFPFLGIHATLPPTTIHRDAQVRMLQ